GMPIASPALFEKIGTRFRQAVARFAEMNGIPVVKFKRGVRKIDVMRPLLTRAARAGRPGVVAIGRAQEFQLVWEARKRDTDPSKPTPFSSAKAERRVTCPDLYAGHENWGQAVTKTRPAGYSRPRSTATTTASPSTPSGATPASSNT